MERPNVIRQRTLTVADEWQARDITLTRSEAATAKRAAEALGLPLHHQPTGRTVQLLLQECMNRSLLNASRATSARERQGWQVAYLEAKIALGKLLN